MSGEAGMDLGSGTGLQASNPGLGLACVYGSRGWDWFANITCLGDWFVYGSRAWDGLISMDPGHGTDL